METLGLHLVLIGEGGDLIMVISGHLIDLVLVCLVDILELMQELLLPTRLVLLEKLYVVSQLLVLGDQLLLVSAVCISILVDLNARVSDVILELPTLLLRIAEEFFVSNDVTLEVVNNLNREGFSIKHVKIFQSCLNLFRNHLPLPARSRPQWLFSSDRSQLHVQ